MSQSFDEGALRLKLKQFLKRDSSCAIFLLIFYISFNVGYWFYWAWVYGWDACHNQLVMYEEGLFKC